MFMIPLFVEIKPVSSVELHAWIILSGTLGFTFPADLTKLFKFEVSETNFNINICNVLLFPPRNQNKYFDLKLLIIVFSHALVFSTFKYKQRGKTRLLYFSDQL